MPLLKRARVGGFAVELSQVSLARGGRSILRDLDWRIGPGERWVLLGRNGAGKTQLLKMLAGDVWPTPSGREHLRYRWRNEYFDAPLGVKEEVAYLGAERQDRYVRYEWNPTVTTLVATGLHREDFPLTAPDATGLRRIGGLLRRLKLEGFASRRFLTLSYGERRLALLARALAWNPQLLLLDEFLNGLDTLRRRQVLAWLEGTARTRRSWVLATHRLEDVPRSATHLLVLEDGRAAYAGRWSRTRARRWFSLKPPAASPPRAAAARRRVPRALAHHAAPLIELEDAAVWLDGRRILTGLSFQVRPGECWVLHGGNGAGKSTLLRTLYGDHAVAIGGRIARRGILPGVPLEGFQRRVGLVAPHLQADHPLHLQVREVVATGRHASIGLNARPTRADRAAATAALRQFGAETLAAATLRELSYGQLRRVLFARAWVNRPWLLLLDEPFEGLDPQTHRALSGALDTLLGAGVAVVLATHHRAEWPAAASHELELRVGKVAYAGPLRAGRRPPA
jgi:molybdate transport system ATP-binding protein